jgi:hypothetical protein
LRGAATVVGPPEKSFLNFRLNAIEPLLSTLGFVSVRFRLSL